MPSKKDLRHDLLHKRMALSETEKSDAARLIAQNIEQSPDLFRGKRVAVYHPIKDEVGIQPLLTLLEPLAASLALPSVEADGRMVFKGWDGLRTEPDAKGIATGTGDAFEPEVVFVPMLAFNRTCHRLGYGAGFYDKTLALLPAVRTIGLAYSWQETPNLPVEPHDVALNEIWTEKERIYAPQERQ